MSPAFSSKALWCFFFIFVFFRLSSSEESFKCPEQFGYYPDLQDCSKYYVCVFGDSLHEKCTGGLFFSVELQTCDWPRNVQCANGDKPNVEPVVAFDDDEVFSSSRRATATATNAVRPPANPEPINNFQPSENKEKEFSRTKPQINNRPRTLPDVNAETAANSQTRQKPNSNPTTLPDKLDFGKVDHNPAAPAEDPLYLSDERSKVLDPLDNYDSHQPDFDDAAPPLVDSEGGIHIADGGHGLDAFGGLSHLPGLGDYSVIAKPVYNPNSGLSDQLQSEDPDYTRDRRKSNSGSTSATKPRSFQSDNNGRSKDPDVIIDYANANKDTQWNHPNANQNFGTPPPTIFDDNADHRDYGRFDIITPLKTNIQADQDPSVALDHRVTISDTSDVARDRTYNDNIEPQRTNIERTRPNLVRPNKVTSNGKTEERPHSEEVNQDRTSDHNPVHNVAPVSNSNHPADISHELSRLKANNYNSDITQSYRNSEYAALSIYRPPKEQPRNRPNVASIEYIPTNNAGNTQLELRKNSEINLGLPNQQTASGYDNQHSSVRNNVAGENSASKDPKVESDSEYRRLTKANERENSFTTLNRNSGSSKDASDTPHPEDPFHADFGVYTGNQRQNRKLDEDQEDGYSKGIMPAESIQPAVRQPNVVNRDPPKVQDKKELQASQPQKPPYNEEYDEIRHEYGEYDTSKPQYTDDYYTNPEDHDTASRVTPQGAKTRPRKPITTTTTTTTPAPIRVRTRKPISQVTPPTNKPSYVATTVEPPPSRPLNVYPTPQPYTAGQQCDPRKCKLPDCRCGGIEIPGELEADQIPQIVVLTFDDAVNDLNDDLYDELFNTGRLNPNGCPILGTFYISHEWTDYGQVQTLYSNGHEIASHSITHSYGEKFSKNQWLREIQGQREILHQFGGVKLEDIRGMRAPFLQIGGNKQFEMLYDSNFTYDSSMPVYENNPPFWPYTLDYALNHDCMIFPCPTKSYPGLWEVGMVMWVDLRGGRCSMGDACSNPSDEEAVTKMLMKNFNRHYKTNRAPFGLFYHSAWFNTQHHRRGFMKFLDDILKKEDVYLVTNWQLIQWMREPTPLSKINDFEPFNCRKLDRPPPCPNPTVCNVWYQGGVRYMKTCKPCPIKYPWIGNTGYENKSKG